MVYIIKGGEFEVAKKIFLNEKQEINMSSLIGPSFNEEDQINGYRGAGHSFRVSQN